jgi:hypothetical protein
MTCAAPHQQVPSMAAGSVPVQGWTGQIKVSNHQAINTQSGTLYNSWR